jgi:hypothetical protein
MKLPVPKKKHRSRLLELVHIYTPNGYDKLVTEATQVHILDETFPEKKKLVTEATQVHI